MATKTKKISVNAFEKAVKDMENTISVEWNGLTIAVKNTLPLRDMLMFVNDVYKSCFSDKDEYMPEVKDFAIKSCVLEYHTNLTLPDNVEKKYDMVYATNIFDVVFAYINKTQFDAMVAAASEKIKQTTDARAEMLTKQMNDLYSALDSLQTNLGDVFEGINASDLKSAFAAMSNGGLDENKLVEAIMGQKYGSEKKG